MEGSRHRLLGNDIKKEQTPASGATQPHPSDDSDVEPPRQSDDSNVELPHPCSSKQYYTGKSDAKRFRRVKQESQQSFFSMSSGIIGTRATIALYVLGMYLALCCLKMILLSVQTTICETPGLGNLVHCPLPGKLDFKRLTIIQRKLEDVREQVAGGMSLPL